MTVNIRAVDLRGEIISSELIESELPRAAIDIDTALKTVEGLIERIEREGLEAILSIARELDDIDINPVKASEEELSFALENLDGKLRDSLQIAIDRVRAVSIQSKPKDFSTKLAAGAHVSQRWQPVDSVGLYIPGGKAVYPSSVVMNAVPALVAGVKRIVIATPGQKDFDGRAHPTVLATAALLGIQDVYVIGGPAAIIAFALGIPEIGLKPVNLVTGPGNIYVAAAKRLLRGRIAVDSEAGPTEILIIADKFANPDFVAADLISQAEHDELAAAVLVTDSEELLNAVKLALAKQIATTANKTRVEVSLGGQQSALVLVDDLAHAVAVANVYSTEHLAIQTTQNEVLLESISNAGAIFLGNFSPVSLGDYLAGSNHVLPTGGQASFGPGLGVHTFLRAQQVINYDNQALSEVADNVVAIAESEGLSAHGDAIKIRFN